MKHSSVFILLQFLILNSRILQAQWVETDLRHPGISCFAVCGNNIFAGLGSNGIYFSTNNGLNWTQVNNGLHSTFIYSLAASDSNIFVGTSAGLYISTNDGTNWSQINNGIPTDYNWVSSLAVSGNKIFAGIHANEISGHGGGIFLSTNNGSSWSQIYGSGDYDLEVSSIAVSGDNIFAGTFGNGILISRDNGISWTSITGDGYNMNSFYSIAVNGIDIFAGTTYHGLYHSTNNGVNWVQSSQFKDAVYSLAVNGTNIFAGTDYGSDSSVYLSKNNGTNWEQINTGLPKTDVNALVITGNNIFAGTLTSGVWRRPLSELVGVIEENTELPKQYTLSQNYPNPFNPSTIIKYSIPKGSMVSIKVYDITGNEIKTLVNEDKPAGNYEITFNAVNLPSGVYFYRIQAGSFTATKKMMVLK